MTSVSREIGPRRLAALLPQADGVPLREAFGRRQRLVSPHRLLEREPVAA